MLEGGRRAIRSRKKQLLTKVMKQKRLVWAKRHLNWTVEQWKKVLFTDESHFMVQRQRCAAIRKSKYFPIKDGHIIQTTEHLQKVMFWGCFDYKGPGRLHICDGMMNSNEYIKVINHRIVHQLQQDYPDGDGLLQHDLAPCHSSTVVINHLKNIGVKVMNWPENSPDIAPIENM